MTTFLRLGVYFRMDKSLCSCVMLFWLFVRKEVIKFEKMVGLTFMFLQEINVKAMIEKSGK